MTTATTSRPSRSRERVVARQLRRGCAGADVRAEVDERACRPASGFGKALGADDTSDADVDLVEVGVGDRRRAGHRNRVSITDFACHG